MNLLKVHKHLLIALAVVIAAWGAAYYMVLLPQHKKIAELQARNEGLKTDLRTARVSEFDPRKLTIYRDNLHEHKVGMAQRFQQVYTRAMNSETRMGQHLADYVNVNGLKRTVNTIAYQEAFLKMKNDLAIKGININDKVLGLNEDSVDPNTYRLMAHLWIIEDLARLADSHNLQLNAPNENVYQELGLLKPETPMPLPARIRALGVIVHRADAESPAYMEEYPVRIRVTGSMQDVSAFLLNLTSGEYFMPLSEVAIMRTDTMKWRHDQVEATLVCSGFLIMSNDLESLTPVPLDTTMHNVSGWKPGT